MPRLFSIPTRRSLTPWLVFYLILLGSIVYVAGQAPASTVTVPEKVIAATPVQHGLQAFVATETSTPVVDVLYRYGQVDAAPNGAYSVNVNAPRTRWYVEYQRAGGTDIIDGVVRHDPALVDDGLRMFRFALDREAQNGSFPGSMWPFHGTAMFLSEAAPALLILQTSRYAARYGTELRREAQDMQRAAHYMVRTVHGPGGIDDTTKNHRYYEAAIALGAVGVLAHDQTLVEWSRVYAWHGIHMEWSNGVMPEDGGHDTGYQALGMVNATRYLTLVSNGGLYRSLYAALRRGEQWELSRVGPNGSVNQIGDTRTVNCAERDPAGQCKTVFYSYSLS